MLHFLFWSHETRNSSLLFSILHIQKYKITNPPNTTLNKSNKSQKWNVANIEGQREIWLEIFTYFVTYSVFLVLFFLNNCVIVFYAVGVFLKVIWGIISILHLWNRRWSTNHDSGFVTSHWWIWHIFEVFLIA